MFRPCIDLHEGKVKQIVGGTLSDRAEGLRTNFVSEHSAGYYATLYRDDRLTGGHVIMLGPGNEAAAAEALNAYPQGLHVGGGIQASNAKAWLDRGASHVIVTSWVFREGRIDWQRLQELVRLVGKERLVLDLSCRKKAGDYFVVTDRWQTFTEEKLSADWLAKMATHCNEFLIHAADVEGLCRGIDLELVEKLAAWTPIPTTYAGGAKSLQDLVTVDEVGKGKIDLTIGSALDIFGGHGVKYSEVVAYNRSRSMRGSA